MKHLEYFSLFENKSIDMMLDKYKSKGITIDESDYNYFKKVTQKLPNNLRKLLLWLLEGEEASEVSVVYDYYLELRNKHLKVPDINQFKKSEDLYDALQIVENNYKINRIVQELPSDLKSQYKKLSPTLKSTVDSLFKGLSEKDEKNQLIKKISRYKTIGELSKVIDNLLSSPNGYTDMLVSIENDPNSDLIYFENGIIIAKINDYSSSCKLGSSSWCISTSERFFKSYTTDRDQYFIWDFNLNITDPLSLIGLTKNKFEELNLDNIINQGKTIIDLQIRNVHDRNDRTILNNIVNIIKEKKIPFDVLFDTDEKEMIFNSLIKSNVSSVVRYLIKNPNLTDEVCDHIIKNRSTKDVIKMNQEVIANKVNHRGNEGDRLSKWFNLETLNDYLKDLLENDKKLLLEICISKYDKTTSTYFYTLAYTDFISINDLLNYTTHKNDDISNHYISTGTIRKISLSRIEKINDLDEKFEYLFNWYWGIDGITRPAKNLLLSICENNNQLTKTKNKIKALKLIKNNFESSKLLKDIELDNIKGLVELESLVHNIFQYKPKVIYKKEFISNVLDFITRLNENKPNSVIIDVVTKFDFKYMGLETLKLFKIFPINFHNKLYDSINGSHNVGVRLKSKSGWEYMKDINVNGYLPNNPVYQTLVVSTPKDIKDNLDLLNIIIDKTDRVSDKHIYVITSGNKILINKYFNDIIDRVKLYVDKKYFPDYREVIHLILKSKKMSYNDFRDLIRSIFYIIEDKDEQFRDTIERYSKYVEGDDRKKEIILRYLYNNGFRDY